MRFSCTFKGATFYFTLLQFLVRSLMFRNLISLERNLKLTKRPKNAPSSARQSASLRRRRLLRSVLLVDLQAARLRGSVGTVPSQGSGEAISDKNSSSLFQKLSFSF